MTPAPGIGRRGAVEVGAAVPVVVHPGEVGSEWREVQSEVRSPTVVLVAGRSGRVLVALRAGQRRCVESRIEAGELRETAVAAFLVGNDQLLHGHRVGRRNRSAGPSGRAPRATGRS